MLLRSVGRALRTPHVGTAPLLWCLLVLTWSGTTLAALTRTELISDVLHGREPGQTVRPPATDDAFAITPTRPSLTHDEPLQLRSEAPAPEPCDVAEAEVTLADGTLNPAAATCLGHREAQRAEARRDVPAPEAEYDDVPLHAESDLPQPGPETLQPERVPRGGALCWLKEHHHREGYWSASKWHESESVRAKSAHATGNIEHWGLYNEAGTADGDLEATALALLVFTNAGYDHKSGDYRNACRQSILWLRAGMDVHGRFIGARSTRDQALATAAMCDAFGLSGDQVLKALAEKAVKALLDLRVAESGWGEFHGSQADVVSTF